MVDFPFCYDILESQSYRLNANKEEKMMKKLLALLLCLMMLPMLPAMAEEAEMLVVYAQVLADWTWPCV